MIRRRDQMIKGAPTAVPQARIKSLDPLGQKFPTMVPLRDRAGPRDRRPDWADLRRRRRRRHRRGATGGRPEGIIAAAAMRCMGGVLQARLAPTDDSERQTAIDAGHDLAAS